MSGQSQGPPLHARQECRCAALRNHFLGCWSVKTEGATPQEAGPVHCVQLAMVMTHIVTCRRKHTRGPLCGPMAAGNGGDDAAVLSLS
jgi:hypothetical protein